MTRSSSCLLAGVLLLCKAVPAQNLLKNGEFEATRMVKGAASADIGFGSWQLGATRQAPGTWILNPAYPGTATVVGEGAYSGRNFLRITGNSFNKDRRGAHLHQPCPAIEAGKWYRVTARIRGGRASIGFYEYYQDAPCRASAFCSGTAGPDEWREISGYYVPTGAGFKSAWPAIMVDFGGEVDVDRVRVEASSPPKAGPGMEPVVIENEVMRMVLSPFATLSNFVCKETEVDYALPDSLVSIFRVNLAGTAMPARSLSRRGDTVDVQFPDPDVKVSLRIEARDRYVTVEVMDVQPADLKWLTFAFPLKRLATQGPAFAANYDDAFAACVFALNPQATCSLEDRSEQAVSLGATLPGWRGIKGARIALLGTPRTRFATLIQEVERDAGLPSPILDGKWIRESEPIRRSYLFATAMHEQDTDALIEYAKVGHFQTIMILKDAWLETHGHYEINTDNFPDGRASFKRTIAKIHAAGLKAGVHLFGPSISPNDAYVTPVPDDRLPTVQCPPLAEGIDAVADVLTLTGQPECLPSKSSFKLGFPEHHLRVGNEIIRYNDVEVGPPFRFTGCSRGACGTTTAAHAAGAPVRGLITKLGFFMLKPDGTLLDEVTTNLADIVNDCGLDMVYFDASDCARHASAMGKYPLYYYLDKCHLAFYRKFDHDVIYQTSCGLAFNLLWHMVARSASADGHGDIKSHMDQRLSPIVSVRDSFSFADVGWYGLDPGSRPDRLEYICGKCLGADGSISVQADRHILETHPHAREIMEMIGRYERCRIAGAFPESVKAQLLEKNRDFKLYEDGKGGWLLRHAVYEPDRVITQLDGRQNVWTVRNDLDQPCRAAFEITRGQDYNSPNAVMLENFDDLSPYDLSARNRYEEYVLGGGKVLTDQGPVRQGVTQNLTCSREDPRAGGSCGVYAATNTGADGGWSGKGKKFPKPVDLSHCRGIALWLRGDGKNEVLALQFRDVTGRYHQWHLEIGFKGWRLKVFHMPENADIDWSKIDYMIFYYNKIPANTTVACGIDGVKALPRLARMAALSGMELTVNGRRIPLPGELRNGQTLTTNSLGTCALWPGGMKPARRLSDPGSTFELAPGDNRLEFKCEMDEDRRRDVNIRVIRLWPVSE